MYGKYSALFFQTLEQHNKFPYDRNTTSSDSTIGCKKDYMRNAAQHTCQA